MSANIQPLSVLKERPAKDKWYSIPKRYVQALLGFFALFIMAWMQTSYFAALFCILNPDDLHAGESQTIWSKDEVVLVDSAFSWGFTAAQIPGALLTFVFSSHRVLLGSVALATIFHIILPFCLYGDVASVVIIRLLQGVAEGPSFLACAGIWTSWAAPSERTSLFCIVLCGSIFGLVAGYPLNLLLDHKFGIKACFFVSGAGGLIWCLTWILQTYENPSDHPHISHHELSHLEENIDVDNKQRITVKSVPWKSIFCSLQVWVACLASFGFFFSQYVLQLLPFFVERIATGFENDHLILYNVLPTIIIGVVMLGSGFFADFLVNTMYLQRTLVRKLFCCGAFALHGIALLVIRYYANVVSTTICLNLAHGFLGFTIAGFWVNCLDFSPCYSSLLMALFQMFGGLSLIIVPAVLNPLLEEGIFEWSALLDAIITISFIIALIYAFFGSGSLQWWGKPETAHAQSNTDVALRSTYYSYPDGEDSVELIEGGQQFPDVFTEPGKERY